MFRRQLEDQPIAFLAHHRIGARQLELARDPDGLVSPIPKQFNMPFHRPPSLSICRNIGRLPKCASGPIAGRGRRESGAGAGDFDGPAGSASNAPRQLSRGRLAARRRPARGLYLQAYPLSGGRKMQVSYFENGRYYAPTNLPRQWPMPAGAYDRDAGLRAFRGMVERSRYAEELGYDWVSISEHHYSPRILTPSLPIAAAYIASHVHNIKIALLGPIVPQSNPVLLAEEMAMLDTMAEGRLIVGMLRGTTNEMMTYDLNPEESRERTDEGMELILRAWK